MSTRHYIAGTLRELWDDATRTYTAYDEAGAQVESRAYTADENAAADASAAAALADANRLAIDAALDSSLATLQTILDDTNSNINSNPAQRIKELARVQRRIIRHVLKRYDGTA